MNRLTYLAACSALFVLISCKEEQQPVYDKWDSRPLRIGDRALSWFLTRYDSTMYDIALDSQITHSGKWAAHIFSVADSPRYIGGVWHSLDPDLFRARKIKFRGWVRSENVSLSTIWFYAEKEPLAEEEKTLGKKFYEKLTAFAGYEELPEHVLVYERDTIIGSQDWTQYTFTADIAQGVKYCHFGVWMEGTGKLWVDDFSYQIVGTLPTDSTYKDISSYLVKPKDLNFEKFTE